MNKWPNHMDLIQGLIPGLCLYREHIHSVAVYQKYLTRLGELIIFEPWRENYPFSQLTAVWNTATLCTYSIYLSTYNFFSFIISNWQNMNFCSRWKCVSCFNHDIISHVDCVIKCIYVLNISFFVQEISLVYEKKYPWYIKKIYIS